MSRSREATTIPTAQTSQPAGDVALILSHEGQPVYALIEYDLYVMHQDEIEAWRVEQRRKAELLAEARRIRAEIERDPAKEIPLAELKRQLQEKMAV
jgi:hypothetical protein